MLWSGWAKGVASGPGAPGTRRLSDQTTLFLYPLSLYLTWKPLPSLGIMFYFKARYSKSSSLTLKSESHLWRPFPPFGQNLTSAKMISRCSFKISNVQIQNIQCSPFVDTVTAGHWGGAGRRPWETENLLRARQLVPHLLDFKIRSLFFLLQLEQLDSLW